ncbi:MULTISPECIES: hypothetical protein [Burkholderia]|uniref:hypothetical protein n=1 Tax=Burkholderia TaxID=32008 RepID=UPI000F52475A|nr:MULTISPECIES: hypothetical protein [Burkholderia]MBJ9665621.1 hypothetical protein [Burkholderia gladioli]MBJ9716118.1 hypothetical protein [Burkholderia gladioli]MBU9159490.1 hypothetical protein [Burkholderia gladioli]MBU9171975.1 hypothetical protein [Burkholderia gladioli]MBU9219063.1 hypothetical protein [Burkholderia gladioli]
MSLENGYSSVFRLIARIAEFLSRRIQIHRYFSVSRQAGSSGKGAAALALASSLVRGADVEQPESPFVSGTTGGKSIQLSDP